MSLKSFVLTERPRHASSRRPRAPSCPSPAIYEC